MRPCQRAAPSRVTSVRRLSPRQWIGVLRAASGLLFLLRPSVVATSWVGRDDQAATALTRSVGARDAVIGAGLAVTGDPEWLAASVVADLVDGVDAATGGVPTQRRTFVMALAFGFASLGIAAEWASRRS